MNNLRNFTGDLLSEIKKLREFYDVKCDFSDTVNTISFKGLKKEDKNFHVLVLESVNLSQELFGNDSKGGED